MSVTFTAAGATPVDWEADEPDESLHLNLNNRNAGLVLDALGLPRESEHGEFGVGNLPASDFLGRVLLALALAPADEGMPAHTLAPTETPVWAGGARWTEGARRPGYLQERLGELHELASWAVAHDTEVVWS